MLKKRLISLLLILSILFAFNTVVYAQKYVRIQGSSVNAQVVQVIDGDAIKVMLDSGEYALIKLVGVDTRAYDKAYEYLLNLLSGQRVLLVRDSGVSTYSGSWNYMQVFLNGMNVSSNLIAQGLGVLNTNHSSSNTYSELLREQNIAKSSNIEIWKGDGTVKDNEVRVNINVASASVIGKSLKNVSSTLAENIVRYRRYNPFSSVKELKFVSGMTQEIFEENKSYIGVYTNINSTNQEELESLGINSSDAKNIITESNKSNFNELSQLKDKGYITSSLYDSIRQYVGTKTAKEISVTENSYVANINGSYDKYIKNTEFGNSLIDSIVSNRYYKGYTFKTMKDLSVLSSIITDDYINRFEDNINFVTDLNSATNNEMKSIFTDSEISKIKSLSSLTESGLISCLGKSRYDAVKGIISFSTGDKSFVNLNTANRNQLKAIGATDSMIDGILGKSGNMKTIKDIPVDVSSINDKVTLYTDINKADKNALMSLNNGMTEFLASGIVSRAQEAPFGSMEEVKAFFIKHNSHSVYNGIQNFICVR